MADVFTRGIFKTVQGEQIRYNLAPAAVGDGTGGVALTVGAGPAWGAYADLAAALAIATDFWICGLGAYTATGVGIFQVQLANSTPTKLADFGPFDFTAVTLNVTPQMLTFPIKMAAGSQVQGRAGGSAVKAISCQMIYAVGL
jgi:hypothetical protein